MNEPKPEVSDAKADAGGNAERVRREDPERTRPLRSWWGMFRPWDRQATPGARPPSGVNGSDPWSSVVDRAVGIGYRVIDEQIRQGQRAAREFSNQAYGPPSMNRDLQELLVRTMRYYADTVALWIDFLGALPGSLGAASSPLTPGGRRPDNVASGEHSTPDVAAAPRQEAPADQRAVSIQLSRPATVNLDLRPGSQDQSLSVPPLHATEGDAAPITDIGFEPGTEIMASVLRITIAEDQPPGTYSGVVFDNESGQPKGTLVVRLDG